MAVDMTSKKGAYVNRVVIGVTGLLEAVESLKALRAEWDALGYSGGETAIVDAEVGEANPHLTAAILGSAFSSLSGIRNIIHLPLLS